MESLYTKYRPQTFEQVVGQEHVVETLKRAVVEGKTSHAYLFCGPRGTGKTTMARLLAKALMCECGPGALPDGTCEQCKLIAAGEHPDVIELDAASRTGVENVRDEIISRVNYAPSMGRCKVYIIDEVHMLSTAAFNALLKTLEEPPAGVVFIMCTTDPQKVLATILSRVQRFDFHAIGNEAMQAHLADVCRAEGFTYDDAALELVVRHARGGMRDALTSLEQLSVFGAGSITLAAANDFLGEVRSSVLGQVGVAMARRDVATLFEKVGELVNAGRDLLQFTRELAAHVRDVYVVSVVPNSDDVVAARGEELAALRAEAAEFGSPDRLARVLSLLGDASNEMRTATNQRLVLEIAFTKIARPEVDLTLDALADRVAVLEQKLAGGVAVIPSAAAAGAPASAALAGGSAGSPAEKAPASSRGDAVAGPPVAEPPVATAPVAAQPAAPAPKPAPAVAPATVSAPMSAPASAAAPAAGSTPPAVNAPAQKPATAQTTSVPVPAAPVIAQDAQAAAASTAASVKAPAKAPVTNGNLQRTWKQVVDELVAKVPAKGSLLLSSTAMQDDGQKLTISLPKGSHFAAKMLERADVRSVVEAAVAHAFGPRQVIYVESSLANAAIAQADRSAASRPASAPAPTQAPAQAPAPKPASTPVPAPVQVAKPASAPAQKVTPAGTPATAAKPVAASAPSATKKPSPSPQKSGSSARSDAEKFKRIVAELRCAFNGEELPELAPQDDVPDEPPAGVSAAAPAVAPAPAAVSAAAPIQAAASAPAPSTISTPVHVAPPAPAQAPTSAPTSTLTPVSTSDLAPDLADLASLISSTFGAPVSMSIETPATTSDEEAAAEFQNDPTPDLVSDFDPDEVPPDAYGDFIDEAMDDYDDTDE